MRRACTPCIVTDEKKLIPLARVNFSDKRIAEAMLQDALHKNPGILPVEEIDASYLPLASIGREIAMIDNLFVSPSGRLTLVETKLWRNPESLREVVGQILDYAAELSTWSYSDLESGSREAVESPLANGESLYQYVARLYPDEVPTESQFVDEVQRSLASSRFLLLVVGDGIREGVERVLGGLHDHPQRLFTFGLVELQLYENPDALSGKIFLPQVVAKTTEIVRAVVRVTTTGQADVSVSLDELPAETPKKTGRRTLSEDVFFSELQDDSARALFGRIFALADELGIEKGWRASSVSLRLPDPKGSKTELTVLVLETSGQLYTGWMDGQLENIGLPKTIALTYVQNLCQIIGGVTPKESGLSRPLKADEVAKKYDQVAALIRDTVQRIKDACGVTESL